MKGGLPRLGEGVYHCISLPWMPEHDMARLEIIMLQLFYSDFIAIILPVFCYYLIFSSYTHCYTVDIDMSTLIHQPLVQTRLILS